MKQVIHGWTYLQFLCSFFMESMIPLTLGCKILEKTNECNLWTTVWIQIFQNDPNELFVFSYSPQTSSKKSELNKESVIFGPEIGLNDPKEIFSKITFRHIILGGICGPNQPPPPIFFQKSDSVTFEGLWLPIYVQKIREN